MYKKESIDKLIKIAKKANRYTTDPKEEREIKMIIKKLEEFKK